MTNNFNPNPKLVVISERVRAAVEGTECFVCITTIGDETLVQMNGSIVDISYLIANAMNSNKTVTKVVTKAILILAAEEVDAHHS